MSEALVREYERIIDNGYRHLPIFQHPLPTAAYGVLAAFDSHMLTERMVQDRSGGSPLSIGQGQLFKALGEGFIFAMRWLLGGCESVDVHPSASETLVAEGADLIQYGSKYFRASMLYSSYSQGQMDATVDPERKAVRFSFKPNVVGQHVTWGYADEAETEMLRKTPRWQKQNSRLQKGAAEAFRRVKYHLDSGRIVLDDASPLCCKGVRQYVDWLTATQRMFSSDQDVGGFAIREFTAFWHAIYAWSFCVTDIYFRCCDSNRLRQETCMPTQVIPRDKFIAAVAMLSNLGCDVVERVVGQLKVDHRTSKLDVYLQPFLCGDHLIAWSVRSAQLSRFQRNLLKLMARTPAQKSLADRVIGDREKDLLAALRTWFEDKGWSVAINRELTGAEDGEVDLIGWNWSYPSEILIIETKAVLQADDPNEVRSATREMRRAQGQIERLTRLLTQMPNEERKSLFAFVDWTKVCRWYGIVVTPEAEPGLDFDQSKIPACSFATLKQRLRSDDWLSPSRLWSSMVRREWQAEIRAGRFVHESMELAGVTFEEPFILY